MIAMLNAPYVIGSYVVTLGGIAAYAWAVLAEGAAGRPTGAAGGPPVDLSPREVVPTAPGRKRKRPWLAMGVLAAVLVGGGVLVFQFLTKAIDYYCNVDEIGVKDGCDVGRTIRIQGVVEQGSISEAGGGRTEFVIGYHGATMPVVVGSQPTGLFQECIPVVVAGKVVEDGGSRVFEGTEVIVKHDNNYDAENADRVNQANQEAAACSQKD